MDDWARIWATVRLSGPRASASEISRSATWISTGKPKTVFGVTRFSERAPATVNALKVEPGSYVNPVAMSRSALGEAEAGSLGSKLGQSAIARTWASRGSMTMTVAPFGR